jgi:hypothetical protein
MKRYSERQVKKLEQKLTRDIVDFIPLFNREPTPSEVMDWATDIYKYKPNGLHNGWAKGLIHTALWGLKVHKNVQKSSFVLYSAVENRVPNNVLKPIRLKEMEVK